MKKALLSLFTLTVLIGMAVPAHAAPGHRHCYYRHHHRHCR
jgi:hypothetical protein